MNIHSSIIDAIGNTPLIALEGFYVKCEFLNPSGSVKDRIAKYFIEKAEKTGQLKKGYTIVEASTGNTGTALAMVGAAKGYRVIIYIARGLSSERYRMISAFGAEVRLVPRNRTDIAVKKAHVLGARPGFYHPDQFSNPWNVEDHEKCTGREILRQLKGFKIDGVVAGIGSGGTIVGLGRAFRKRYPDVKIFGVEPLECAMTYEHLHNMREACRPHRIEGIADGFVPRIIADNKSLLNGIIRIKSRDAIHEAQRIAREHSCFVGVCSGANLLAAKKIKAQYPGMKTIVTLFTDEGEKYLSEKWFRSQRDEYQ
jgi:cysteine synthase